MTFRLTSKLLNSFRKPEYKPNTKLCHFKRYITTSYISLTTNASNSNHENLRISSVQRNIGQGQRGSRCASPPSSPGAQWDELFNCFLYSCFVFGSTCNVHLGCPLSLPEPTGSPVAQTLLACWQNNKNNVPSYSAIMISDRIINLFLIQIDIA